VRGCIAGGEVEDDDDDGGGRRERRKESFKRREFGGWYGRSRIVREQEKDQRVVLRFCKESSGWV
jgi:hypothetical protein